VGFALARKAETHRLKPVLLEQAYATGKGCKPGPRGIKRLSSIDRIKIILFAPAGQEKSVVSWRGRGPIENFEEDL
jgi:hypothetical protein